MILITCAACLGVAIASAQNGEVIIAGGTVIDGTGRPPLPHAEVIIDGDKIARVDTSLAARFPEGSRIIDATGKFVLPGLIDTHVHLEQVGLSDVGGLAPKWSTPAAVRELIMMDARLDFLAGVTTVRDLGSTPAVLAVRDSINAGTLLGPRIVAAGMQLVKRSPTEPQDPIFLEFDGVESARARVGQLVSLGVDVIKIRLTRSRPVPSLDEVRAIVAEAHRHGLRATVHTDVPADDLVRLAIEAGADGIEHNAPLRSTDEHLLPLMAQHQMSLMAGGGAFYLQRIDSSGFIDSLDQPQLKTFPPDVVSAIRAGLDTLHQQTSGLKASGWDPRRREAGFVAETQRARKAGVLLVFGTDCGGYGMIHGEQYKALYGETKVGSSAMEVIVMATRDAAKAIGKTDELGTVEAGKKADLVILNADPLADARNLRQVYRVIKDGRVFDPEQELHGAR